MLTDLHLLYCNFAKKNNDYLNLENQVFSS